MALHKKFQNKRESVMRDIRPWGVRFAEGLRKPEISAILFGSAAGFIYLEPMVILFSDLIFFIGLLYFLWLWRTPISLPFKLPKTAHRKDPNNTMPGGGTAMSEGIMYLGNDRESGEEIWFNNNDARTHILYLGTTGSGKTEGLKSISVNALCWASGYVYIDGKADTDLWSTISALARRFGRDDDLLIMNYMTGNVGGRVPSNTMNPFSSGSASYLVNMLTSLMPDAEGDNAMWKERAVALVSSLMPCLVWKRDNQNLPISVGTIRRYMGLGDIIKLSRDPAVPDHLTAGVRGYLNELPGYVDEAFDDEGHEKPLPPDAPPFDSSVPRQQHGYLSMQFTRSLQSLGDDYGFIFDTQAADIDMMDVVLQRRIMITLIPALEKSSDETANLGKIIASTLKGMMGATLGATVEGNSETTIENKPTRSETPFIAIFDEVGYYTSQGMAVMAAQARSLGFCLVYAAQDLPALEKRVKEEARSITANCNIKLFGKLEDPTQTKEFFEKTVGQSYVTEVSGFARGKDGGGGSYSDSNQASVQVRARADYDELRAFTEGRSIVAFGPNVTEVQIFYSNPGFAKAMRVQRFLPVPPPAEEVLNSLREVKAVLKRLRSKNWKPHEMPSTLDDTLRIQALVDGFRMDKSSSPTEQSAMAIANLAECNGHISVEDMVEVEVEENQPETENTAPVEDDELPVTSDDGPLSWLDVIGGGTAKQTGVGETVTADKETEDSWDSLIGQSDEEDENNIFDQIFGNTGSDKPIPEMMKDEDALPAGISLGGSVDPDPTPASMAAPQPEASADGGPMSWADIIGAPKSASETPAAPPAEKQKKPPETPVDKQPQKPAEKPIEKPAEKKTAASDTGSSLTWADVIGGGNNDGDADQAKSDKQDSGSDVAG
jgi:intracellular multiplication protein IcmO